MSQPIPYKSFLVWDVDYKELVVMGALGLAFNLGDTQDPIPDSGMNGCFVWARIRGGLTAEQSEVVGEVLETLKLATRFRKVR